MGQSQTAGPRLQDRLRVIDELAQGGAGFALIHDVLAHCLGGAHWGGDGVQVDLDGLAPRGLIPIKLVEKTANSDLMRAMLAFAGDQPAGARRNNLPPAAAEDEEGPMNYEEIRISSADRTATVTLNRPDRLNAWTSLMASEVRHAVGEAGRDPEVRCIVITGEGRGFCAGADMGTLDSTAERGGISDGKENFLLDDVTYPNAPGPDLGDRYPGHFGYFYSCPKPIVAQINGPCAGIGLVLALYADLRFAADDARLTTSFAARGLVAEHGIAWLLPRLIGEGRALDLLFSARKFSGAEAETIGLVNKAVPVDALSAHVSEVARVFAQDVSPRSVAVMKRQVRAAHFQSFAESLAMADAEMEHSFSAPDFKEGIGSFVQRRAPAFPGV